MSTAGASILAVGYLIPLVYLVVDPIRTACALQSLERDRSRVADAVPAPDRELRSDSSGDRGGVRVRKAAVITYLRRTAAVAHHFEGLQQQRDAATLAMWIFLKCSSTSAVRT